MAEQRKNVPGPETLSHEVLGEDDSAISEASAIAEQNLDEISQAKEHGRKERFRDHASRGAVLILWLLMGATAIAIFAVAWHFLAPAKWSWLDEAQLTAVKTYVFSGAVIAAISGYMRKYLD